MAHLAIAFPISNACAGAVQRDAVGDECGVRHLHPGERLGGMEERAGVGSPRADPEPAPCRRGRRDGPERARRRLRRADRGSPPRPRAPRRPPHPQRAPPGHPARDDDDSGAAAAPSRTSASPRWQATPARPCCPGRDAESIHLLPDGATASCSCTSSRPRISRIRPRSGRRGSGPPSTPSPGASC